MDRIAATMPLSSTGDYASFLGAQFAARAAMEDAFATTSPGKLGQPPQQTQLILADLAELGYAAPPPVSPLHLRGEAQALGAAWVVAGSSLGNRAMLAQRGKAGLGGAERFLSDPAMPAYFKRLLDVLESPANHASIEGVIDGAHEAFALFECAFAAQQLENAA
ncbi:biliverdin-producing heme oxygenase [Qipengyuania gelatinilytica]|uniref:Biliverdin-producing heme oxygenase n=1 Tax=Qipengyuania gelatinilytica TaxID=2867231 RepID=A0ABX9A4W3_9SPHN|nr:biliverdin-producing heme oxygenase [Qipengyuania gelatinilytica]QZD96265.1 biliverdin-producing heme oxygenase [Qipengyuania gelatinilytica]